MTTGSQTRGPSWLNVKEVGSVTGMRLVVWLARIVGRRPIHALLYLISAYYLLSRRQLRHDIADYCRHLGIPPSLVVMHRQVYRFAQCTLDRMYFWMGKFDAFEIERVGDGFDRVRALIADGRGGIFVGAHLGSFEALRGAGRTRALPLHIVVHQGNAAKIASMVAKLGADSEKLRLIEIDPSAPTSLLRVQALIERGEWIGILADRAGLNPRVVRAPFLGESAAFPAGPWILAGLLQCPVFLAFGLFEPPNRYRLVLEEFSPGLAFHGRNKDIQLQQWVGRYANRLEMHCKSHPDNWFNFYAFWQSESSIRHE